MRTPMRRFGELNELVGAAVFLASDAASFVTGHLLVVDGGFLAFPHDVPTPNTRRVNMTLDFGPGVTIPMRGNNALRTGVWLYHFSDGNTAPRNPAFDGVMVYVSYTYRNFSPHLSRKLRRQSRLDPNTDTTLQPERVQAGR